VRSAASRAVFARVKKTPTKPRTTESASKGDRT
jgi:hypothetical protein